MEKRNTLLLTIIAIATLLISVVGATFAYFASNINTSEGNVNIDVDTSNKQAVFLASSSGDINITVNSYMMQQHDATQDDNTSNNATIAALLENSATINVSLQAADAGKVSTCSYDLVYKWNSTSENNFSKNSSVQEEGQDPNKYYKSKYYERTTGGVAEGFKELTVEISSMTYTGEAEERGQSNEELQEKNIDAIEKISDDGKITLLKGQEISSDKVGTDNIPHIDYEITFRFYNLSINQSALMDKSFVGTVSVENVKC